MLLIVVSMFSELFPVRYDATEDKLVNEFSQQKRILKRRYYVQLFCIIPFVTTDRLG